jgi:hypothetical protein
MENFFDEMAAALQHHDLKRLEMIGFRGCAKSTTASSGFVDADMTNSRPMPW